MSPEDEGLIEIRENAYGADGLAYDIDLNDPVRGDYEGKVVYDDPERQRKYHDAHIPIGRNGRHLQDVIVQDGRRFLKNRLVGPWCSPDEPYRGPLRATEVEYCKRGKHPQHLDFTLKRIAPAKEET